jgi:hypothetical protein
MDTMLSTYDNPFNPFTHYKEWDAYDRQLGYHTSALLARVAIVSDQLSEVDYALAVEQAIDEIVKENVSGMHRKVTRPVDKAEIV